jgi:acetyl-CoA C-acetyltransferase
MDKGIFAEEIAPVIIPDKKKGDVTVESDESPRRDTNMEALAKLKPVFDPNGTVTAGNAPGINDGAAAVVVASSEYAKAHGLKPLARILGYGEAAWDTPYLAYVPAMAGQNALKKLGMTIDDIDLVEINEAFASVALISMSKLGLNEDKVNVNGGAIALGHPIGASGARLVITLIHELRRRGGGIGMAAICSGTAQGDAIILQVGE